MVRWQPGEKYKLNVDAEDYEPTYDAAYLAKVDYDMWLGPGAEAAVQPQSLPLQLALALGLRQRRHAATRARTSSTSRAGASARTSTL